MTLRHSGWCKDQDGNPAPIQLVVSGPLVEVTLGLHPDEIKSIVESGGVPKTMVHRLLIDTGAQCTSVENVIPLALGLVPIRYQSMMGVSYKPEDYPVYRMSITLGMADKHGTVVPAAFVSDVVGTPSPGRPLSHVGLLGRDFLRFVQLVYDGPRAEYELVDYQHVSAQPQKTPQLGGWRGIERARKHTRRHRKNR